MIAQQLLTNEAFALKKSDHAEAAITFMQDWKLAELPVVDGNKLIGQVSLHSALEAKPKTKVDTLLDPTNAITVSDQTHQFELIRIFSETGFSTLSVLDKDHNYIGIITFYDLIKSYKQSALAQPGAIITLRMPSRNYSLAEISRLTEMNDVKIIHVYISKIDNQEDNIEVSIKINSSFIKNVLSTFDRYQYQITGVFLAESMHEEIDSRYKLLMHYLK